MKARGDSEHMHFMSSLLIVFMKNRNENWIFFTNSSCDFEGFWKITKIYLNHSVKKSSFAQGTTVYNFL